MAFGIRVVGRCLGIFTSLFGKDRAMMRSNSFVLGLVVIGGSAFASVNLAWAACMTVRPDSPCKTTIVLCVDNNPGAGVVCSSEGETVFKANFQCDLPSADQSCTGSGNFAPCNKICHCIASMGTCVTTFDCENFAAETKISVDCPQE